MERSQMDNSPTSAIMELANLISVSMSLTAVVKLKVPDTIWQNGSNNPLSAAEILSAAAAGPGGDAENLQRILRLLTSYGVFNQHIGEDGSETRYSLTEVGKALAADENGLSYAPYILQHHQDAMMLAWPLVHEAVLDPSSEPFVKVHGERPYSYYGKNPEMNLLMQKAMSGASVPFMKAFLDGYDGFQGVETLVDVGGSSGDCLRMIMTKYQRIEHVGGDMLKSIPPGDAIFMKWLLLSSTDEECAQVLKNCCDVLPWGGKLIVCEPLMPNSTDNSPTCRALLQEDIFLMTMYRTKGKHRTAMEFRELGLAAGFPNFKADFRIDDFFTVLEFQK
ncbi:Caffeic acid 3-O-methyltransferase [Sesamum angolense]|uniref:Caffeic acid 3-O-methyltransferase n=1 Tax=Sesamum angolense TaxID=2727404 RepID=A0AAE1WBC6_9LAMI|nr:Caffeic acid 3-O-methyltransferase [Sesamum angolense]